MKYNFVNFLCLLVLTILAGNVFGMALNSISTNDSNIVNNANQLIKQNEQKQLKRTIDDVGKDLSDSKQDNKIARTDFPDFPDPDIDFDPDVLLMDYFKSSRVIESIANFNLELCENLLENDVALLNIIFINLMDEKAESINNNMGVALQALQAIRFDVTDQSVKNSFNLIEENYKKSEKIKIYFNTLNKLAKLRGNKVSFPIHIFVAPNLIQKNLLPKVDDVLLSLIKCEKESILMAMFHFALQNVADALIERKKTGIDIELVTDRSQGNNNCTPINSLLSNEIPVSFPREGQNHHKFIIFKSNVLNKSLVWIGSYNLTNFANTKSWDDVTILDEPYSVECYKKNFELIKNNSRRVEGIFKNLKQRYAWDR